MDWVKLAIPLIVLAVWILANLARIPRDQPRPPGRRGPLPPEEGPPIARKPGNEVDRFLEEVNRRRRETAERRRPDPEQIQVEPRPEPRRPPERRRISPTDVPVETRTPPTVLPVDVPLPVRPVGRGTPAEARPKRRREPGETAPLEAVPVTPSTRLVDNTAFPDLAPDAAQPTLAPTAAQGSAQVVAPTPITESALEVMAMLRDPKSRRVAYLLREIFEPPLCRRGPRRPGSRGVS